MNKKLDKILHLLGAISCAPESGAMSARQLSSRLGVSISYVEELIRKLKDHGLVSSARGPGGGYLSGPHLACASVSDVYVAMSDGFDSTDQAADAKNPIRCAVSEIDDQLWAVEKAVLEEHKLVDLFASLPRHEPKTTLSSVGIKPIRSHPQPTTNAPSSIFDLARFYGNKEKELRI